MVGEICEDRKKSIFVERGKREKLKYMYIRESSYD